MKGTIKNENREKCPSNQTSQEKVGHTETGEVPQVLLLLRITCDFSSNSTETPAPQLESNQETLRP